VLDAQLKSGSIVWQPTPDAAKSTNMARFMRFVEESSGNRIRSYEELHHFSTTQLEEFWLCVWKFARVIGEVGAPPYLVLQPGTIEGARWFPNATLNIAENMLRGEPSRLAILAMDEAGRERQLTLQELRAQVSRVMQALRSSGVMPGDRVAGYLPNTIETVVACIATLAIGAVWSSCAPNLAPSAVLDRFGQIEPKALFVTNSILYGEKRRDCTDSVRELLATLPSVQCVVSVPTNVFEEKEFPPSVVQWDRWLEKFQPEPQTFERFPFAHPAFILFSSGTTGAPKCITHGCGGALLVHAVDRLLHEDVSPGDRIFETTNPGWMMWNYLVTTLAWESTIVLYDGSPIHPSISRIADVAQRFKINRLGVPTPIVHEWMNQPLSLRGSHNLSSVKSMTVTGAKLHAEAWGYLYRNVNSDMHLSSPSGGTEILSFFSGGNPMGPCRVGEIQVIGLGRAVKVLDEDGAPVAGEPGELVCIRPLPSMPVKFWGDSDGSRYHDTYYSTYPGIWRHGDWAEITPHGGVVMHGRSDSTLKVNGVRLGPSEIYKQINRLDGVVDAVVVELNNGGASSIALFVQLAAGQELTATLAETMRKAIAKNVSAQFVPSLIVQAPDLPRVLSGKVSEMAVKNAVNGQIVTNVSALANPASLEFFYAFSTSISLPASAGGVCPTNLTVASSAAIP
jgi:acetoacetyl-CoA synthetase